MKHLKLDALTIKTFTIISCDIFLSEKSSINFVFIHWGNHCKQLLMLQEYKCHTSQEMKGEIASVKFITNILENVAAFI